MLSDLDIDGVKHPSFYHYQENWLYKSRKDAYIFSACIAFLMILTFCGMYFLLPLYSTTSYVAILDDEEGNHQMINKTISELGDEMERRYILTND